jgi:nitroreductase
MDYFDVVNRRRSVRVYTSEPTPDAVIDKALDAALLAPNSSNTQTWNFYWVKSTAAKEKIVEACLSQSAARNAGHLMVVTADPRLWKRSQKPMLHYLNSIKAPQHVLDYHNKIVPLLYNWGPLNILAPIKWLIFSGIGLFRPMARAPCTRRDSQEVAIKSAALACENFVLAIAAQGYSSCMMEGFDEYRVGRVLKVTNTERVVMVISVGVEGTDGSYGPRFRIPKSEVVKVV